MDIEEHKITIGELTEGYQDNGEEGVVDYGGRLDIRPPYQREFIYKEKQRNAVIHSVMHNFPLNTMYWSVSSDGSYEVMDGQQRTISIDQYITNEFSFDKLLFKNLPADIQRKILDYQLSVYLCSGEDSQKLNWFRTINIAGEKLTDQEMRNAVYAGKWTANAKKYFSKRECPAYQIGRQYISGSPIRQEFLETALKWISPNSQNPCEEYMAEHQHDETADELWEYFQAVIQWIESIFPESTRTKGMQNVKEWGVLYSNFKNKTFDPKEIEEEWKKLDEDEEVQRKSGIYPYLITRDEKYLNLRTFPPAIKRKVYRKQDGKCAACGKEFPLEKMDADHIEPWIDRGKTIEENCQILCRKCNQQKSNK